MVLYSGNVLSLTERASVNNTECASRAHNAANSRLISLPLFLLVPGFALAFTESLTGTTPQRMEAWIEYGRMTVQERKKARNKKSKKDKQKGTEIYRGMEEDYVQ